jgi:hypothetical protein
MTSQSTTPEEEKRIKRYFTEKIDSLKRSKTFYRERLFEGLDHYDPETWDKIMAERPESAISFLTYRNLIEVFEMLEILSNSVIDVERGIVKLDENINIIAKQSDIDFSNIKKNVSDLKEEILPAVKGMVAYFDKNTQEAERRKKNGDSMID